MLFPGKHSLKIHKSIFRELTYFKLQSVISVCAVLFLVLGADIHRGFARSDTGGCCVSGKLLELLIGIFSY